MNHVPCNICNHAKETMKECDIDKALNNFIFAYLFISGNVYLTTMYDTIGIEYYVQNIGNQQRTKKKRETEGLTEKRRTYSV